MSYKTIGAKTMSNEMKKNEDILNINKVFMTKVIERTNMNIDILNPYILDDQEYDIDVDKMLKDTNFMNLIMEPFAIGIRENLDELRKVHSKMTPDDKEDAWDIIEMQMSFFPLEVKQYLTRLAISNIPNKVMILSS